MPNTQEHEQIMEVLWCGRAPPNIMHAKEYLDWVTFRRQWPLGPDESTKVEVNHNQVDPLCTYSISHNEKGTNLNGVPTSSFSSADVMVARLRPISRQLAWAPRHVRGSATYKYFATERMSMIMCVLRNPGKNTTESRRFVNNSEGLCKNIIYKTLNRTWIPLFTSNMYNTAENTQNT